MNHPRPDKRDLDAIRARLSALARSYTPEWRYERTEDDPGAALAELFAEMYHQSVDRLNALPEKLYIEFLNEIGFREPGPMPSRGTLRFLPNDVQGEPAQVAAGTEVFTADEAGDNIVFATERAIQATGAELQAVYYASAEQDSIRRLDFSGGAQRFFAPVGEELQKHELFLSQPDVLRVNGQTAVTLHLGQRVSHLEAETAQKLAEGMKWTYRHDGAELPFDAVRAAGDTIVLEKKNRLSLDPDEEGRLCVRCAGRPPVELVLDMAEIKSEPLEPDPAQSLYSGDLPIYPDEGGYCFGHRPTVYDMFYLRCDTALSKKGARVLLRLEITPMVDAPATQGPTYDFTRSVINKQSATELKPDDAYVEAVCWEYYNGLGWRNLVVIGDRNPFSCKREGPLELRFVIPEDLSETEVNSETGFFIRARVSEVANAYSSFQRWIVPFLTSASFQWSYDELVCCSWIAAENNGKRKETEISGRADRLDFPALMAMDGEGECMYLCFDRSMHAMPLSLLFRVEGRARLEGQLLWDVWNGKNFVPIRALDCTDHLLHSGEMYLYLPEPVPETEFFDLTGCWLRLRRSSSRAAALPAVAAILTNAVPAIQRQREPEQLFDTEIYEAGKIVHLLSRPVQDCEVWVDEVSGLTAAELDKLMQSRPGDVREERTDHVLTRCWVRWTCVDDLALAGPEERVYELEPYDGTIRFGNGRHGAVPPAGDHNIRVRYTSGGGERGNVPAGTVRTPLSALPQIGDITNLTPMSGGTGRLEREILETRGERLLRIRSRAAGRRDYEELVLQEFPQVSHVRCFSGRDAEGAPAPGHVTVVLTGYGAAGEGTEELCREVYRFLSERCSCCVNAEGRLHVCPATVLTIGTEITVEAEDPDRAADTQREIAARLERLIGEVWRRRPIGEQIRVDELWAAVLDTPNVRRIRNILASGAYDRHGQAMLAPLREENDFPYGVAESGRHLIKIE